jgi:CRISPR/Cas system-associated exonuclease Cas4 (RecB family)
MAKNLLKQIMVKDTKKNVKNSKEDESFVEGLVDAINSGYLTKTKPKFTKKNNFSASGITYGAGECPRYWYLGFEGQIFYDNSDAFGVANRTQGTLGHERIQEAIEASGLLAQDMEFDPLPRKYNKQTHPAMEFRVKTDDPPFDGYGDVMLDYKGERLVGEIKTMPNDGFQYKKISRRPKMAHLMQLLMYMKVLKIRKGVMIYENKNNHELLTLPVVVNDHYRNWVEQAFEWMRIVYKNWQDKQLPEIPYRSNSKICKVCPIQKACAEAGTGTIKIKPLVLLKDEEDSLM